MQDDFPKVDLTERGDLDHVLEQIRKHSLALLRDELDKAGQSNDRKVLKTCEETIELWIKSAKKKLESNVTVNGMPFREGTDGTQPFDQELSQRVRMLSERCDTSTAQAIAARKTIPSKRAALLQTRAQLQREIEQKRENKRRRLESEIEKLVKERDSQTGESTIKPLERSEEVADSLRTAKENIDQLAVALVEQTSAANEQAKFVQRLRIMSASYTS
ncbi:uncharacterized protein FA14DRAFT_170083 [Meira miltonrushii]|uniref:Uncharacterized protein n=1 Tax=Meira miltonrushii TaxID=1280837 RepID=A0A316VI39_9BASI|nr:uncharacterized protein FA14DRAFT_170083 [Meira miltonrushii]PWN37206.1 hypothetical protein FA14DRAFT_170083 [Meira miltonrushii]